MSIEQIDAQVADLLKEDTGELHSQGSIEWLYDRLGFCSASRFIDAADTLKKGGESAKRRNYRLETIASRITQQPVEHFVSDAMLWGVEQEPHARMAYEAATGRMVEQVGFLRHPGIEWVGGSPDGLIGEDGGIEIKCPTTPTHMTTLLTGECEHLHQIQGLLWITGRKWWDFVSYDPRMPPRLRLFIKRIERDESFIAQLNVDVLLFLAEVQEGVDKLKALEAA